MRWIKSACQVALIVILLGVFPSCATDTAAVPKSSAPSRETEDAIPAPPTEAVSPDAESVHPKEESEILPLPPVDPLQEVAELWFGGHHERARARFWEDDVRRLSEGPRHLEWSIWRGRLFIQLWKGADFSLAGENISALMVDRDDVWLGTWTGGVSRYSLPLNEHRVWDRGEPSLAVRTVNRIIRTQGSVWLVRYGALERYDRRTGAWSSEKGLPVSERLQDFLVVGDVSFLATLGHGLWVSQDRVWRRLNHPGSFITRLEILDEGLVLVATMDRGFYIYDVALNQWHEPPSGFLSESNVTCAVASGSLLAGGTFGEGAFVWNRETSEFRIFSEDILGDSYVLDVVESGGRFHFGTFGAGLISWMPEKDEWERLSLNEGLPSADVASLAVGNKALWVGMLGGGAARISQGVYGD